MSIESKHTPEPWRENSQGDTEYIYSERHGAIATIPHDGLNRDEHKANAARIVACVNAMKGISDPEAFVRRAIELANTCKEQAEEIYKLKTQNDNKYYLIQGLRATISYLTGMLRKLKNAENTKRTERETEQDSL